MLVYLNGAFLPLAEARISPLDRGFLFGDGVYEMVPVYDGKPFLLKEHLARLAHSLKTVGIKNTLNAEEWLEIIHTLSKQAQTPTHGIYLQITRGAGESRQHQYSADLKPTIFAMTMNIRLLSEADQQTGLSAITMPDDRWKNCHIKSLNLLPNILATQQAYLQNACEAILISDGYVTEGGSSNVFIVKDNVLRTPATTANILWGITRGLILASARAQQIACVEEAISEAALSNADEIWITSSGREIVPITRLNNQAVGNGKVGPVWQQMHAYFQTTKEKLLV